MMDVSLSSRNGITYIIYTYQTSTMLLLDIVQRLLIIPKEQVIVQNCKLMIVVVRELRFSLYCLTTDQLFYRRATQTTETLAGGKPVGYLRAQPKDFNSGLPYAVSFMNVKFQCYFAFCGSYISSNPRIFRDLRSVRYSDKAHSFVVDLSKSSLLWVVCTPHFKWKVQGIFRPCCKLHSNRGSQWGCSFDFWRLNFANFDGWLIES